MIRNVPSTDRTRRASPVSPVPPDGSAPPTPSSRTVTRSASPRRTTAMSTSSAFACRTTLVSASDTTKYATASTVDEARGSTSTVSRTGSGTRAATPDSAASRPRSSSTAGCRPRTSVRSSASASLASSCASTITCMASSGTPVSVSRASPRFSARRRAAAAPVVQVAFDAAALDVGGVHHAGALLGQILDTPLQLLRAVGAEQRGGGTGVQRADTRRRPRRRHQEQDAYHGERGDMCWTADRSPVKQRPHITRRRRGRPRPPTS